MTVETDTASGDLIFLHMSDSEVEPGEIHLADGKTAKVLWKDVLVEGTYPMSPGPTGAVDEPMHVIASGDSDAKTRTISMSDLVKAHDEGAFKYVTIPTRHRDDVLDNTGFVPRPGGVRVVEKQRKGKSVKVFQAALGFTEPDVKGKVERGTIPDVSGGVFFNWLNKATKKRFPCAMKHVALTPVPFMGNLDPFPAVFASDDLNTDGIPQGVTAKFFDFADEGDPAGAGTSGDDKNKGEIVWNENDGSNWLREEIQQALAPAPPPDDGRPFMEQPYYYVRDTSDLTKNALVEESFKGDRKTFVIPFERKSDGVEVAPATRWVESREAMIAASDDTNFAEMTPDVIREKLSVRLSDLAGDEFSVSEVTLDQRAKIKSEQGGEWVADFSVFPDGGVYLAPSARWTKTVEPTPDSGKQHSQSKPSQPVTLSDDVDPLAARVRAARDRRAALAAGRN